MIKELIFPKNSTQAKGMAAYMKNKFIFCGVPTPERRALEKPFLQQSKALPLPELCQLITANFQKEEREYQYYAFDLALINLKRLTLDELELFLPLVGEKVWWDSLDSWRKVYGDWTKAHLDQREIIFSWFFQHENFWYRRVAINLQLMFKEKTDPQLLSQALLFDLATEEFFIQKAIGWSLRDYSKTNPRWVADFIQRYPLSALAKKEGSKYLPSRGCDRSV